MLVTLVNPYIIILLIVVKGMGLEQGERHIINSHNAAQSSLANQHDHSPLPPTSKAGDVDLNYLPP
jgi:hypothetical protein